MKLLINNNISALKKLLYYFRYLAQIKHTFMSDGIIQTSHSA